MTTDIFGTSPARSAARGGGDPAVDSVYARIQATTELATLLAAELDGPAQSITENASFVADVIRDLAPLVARLTELSGADDAGVVGLAGGDGNLAAADLAYIAGELGPATENIVQAARAIAGVIGSLSMLGAAPSRHETTDLNALIERAAHTVRARHPESCRICFDLRPVPELVCDPGLLEGAVVELLDALCDRLGRWGAKHPEGRRFAPVRVKLESAVEPDSACIIIRVESNVGARALAGFERTPTLRAVRKAIVDGHCGLVRLQLADPTCAAMFLQLPLKAAVGAVAA